MKKLKPRWQKMKEQKQKKLAELEHIKELYAEVYIATEKAVEQRRNEAKDKNKETKTDTNEKLKF